MKNLYFFSTQNSLFSIRTYLHFLFTFILIVSQNEYIKAQNRPNILIVIADDMGTDAFSAYGIGTDLPNTPNIDGLTDEGILFMNAWAYGTCAPSRASLITGRYGNKNGVMRSGPSLVNSEVTLFEQISSITDNEYADAAFGKWHLGNASHPNTNGVDHYDGNLSSGVDSYFEWERTINGSTEISTEYVTTHTTDEAINWVDNQTQPWLLWVAYNAPHGPFHLPPDSLYTRTETNSSFDQYMCMIESVDHEVGRLYNSLTQEERDSTIIIFMGDNGTPNSKLQGYPNQHGKGSVYEGGIRVPMIISGYGVNRVNEEEEALVSFVDIFATLTEMLGTDLPGGIDNSLSFLELLSDPDASTKPYNYSELESGGITDRAIRNAQYKLILKGSGEKEFYDLIADPFEEEDLIPDGLSSNQQQILDELEDEADSIFNSWSCNDAIQNGDEEDIDCGGSSCVGCFPLPVELAYFRATKRSENVLLEWETIAEINNDEFILEVSQDAISWQRLGVVEGAGTTDERTQYSFYDKHPKAKNYYRLIQVDFDNNYSYSNLVFVEFEDLPEASIAFFPNPVQSYLNINSNEQSLKELNIFDISSKLVYSQNRFYPDESINLAYLKSGIYFLEIKTEHFTKRQKIIKVSAL